MRRLIAIGLLCIVSCASTPRRRAASGVPQWNHEWARGAVFYEIFVRSFADSDGDGIGDFNGMTAKLDYLNDGNPRTTTDLGIDGIWLMPMFESTSYHGYDTIDYDNVEKDYGTNDDFRRFLAEAHKRGIRVILDLVMNHTSVEHPWFLESASSTSSPKRDWYVWQPVNPGWKQPWGGNDPSWHSRNGAYYYGAFWSGMPDVNFRSPEAKAEMFRIARHWLEQGVDGYRLDATRYLVETGPGEAGQADTPETHAVLKELSTMVRRVKPEAILVAENTVDTAKLATYFGSTSAVAGGDEMPMNFNFPLAGAIVEAVRSGDATRVRSTLADMIALYPKGIIDTPFLTNHDQIRIATVLRGDQARLRNAAAILLTLPGTPFLYYGEEVGMQNGPTNADEWKRTPMPWTPAPAAKTWHPYAPGLATDNVASQTNDPASLLSHYRNWIAVRKGSRALSKGWIQPLDTSAGTLAYTRFTADETVVVVHNLGDTSATITLPVSAVSLTPIYGDAVPTRAGGAWTVSMSAHSSAVWRMQ